MPGKTLETAKQINPEFNLFSCYNRPKANGDYGEEIENNYTRTLMILMARMTLS